MRPLDRKLVRDVRRLAPQLLAIAVLGSIGVAVAVMAAGTLKSVTVAQRRFYSQTRFADIFAGAVRAPLSLRPRLQAIDGAVAVDVRATGSGLMTVPGVARPAIVRLIALPAEPQAALNGLVLRRGRLPAEGRKDEAVAAEAFLNAAHVDLGTRLTATINGRRVAFTIVGSVLSPEFVYATAAGAVLPDEAHMAVLWAPRGAVEDYAGQVGAFAQVALKIAPGVHAEDIVASIDRLLTPYGGTPAVTRENQPSHHLLAGVLKRLRLIGLVLPPLFLAVAAALVHALVARLIETEREQIGLLKAFGYSDVAAAIPYLKLAALIGILATLLGGAAGALFTAQSVRLEAQYFRFPVFAAQFDWTAFALSSLAAFGAAVAGGLIAVRRVVSLQPAVAMQAPAPIVYRRGILDRLGVIGALDQPTRMVLRRIRRYPGKAAFVAVALATSLALVLGTEFVYDAMPEVLTQTYYRAQRWSAQLTFLHPRQTSALTEALHLPGVALAEPVRTASVWAQGPRGRKLVPVLGLEPEALLARALDEHGNVLPFEDGGVIVSEALARQLGLVPGDRVDLQFLEGLRPRIALPVTAESHDESGLFLYMARRELNRRLGEGDLASAVDLAAATDQMRALYRALEERPEVTGAASRDDTVANWRAVSAQSFSVTLAFYLGFAIAIAYSVAYNVGRISLSERARDIATLQALGFSYAECAYILLGELLVMALLAVPLGIALGIGLAHGTSLAFSRDELQIPIVITSHTVGLALVTYSAAILLAAAFLLRRLRTLDAVTVLKSRE